MAIPKEKADEILGTIQASMPGQLVLSARKTWDTLASGRETNHYDELLFWQSLSTAYTAGTKNGLERALQIHHDLTGLP